jgi:hypothetical protein
MEIITTYTIPKLLSAFRRNPGMPSRNRRVRSNPLWKNTDLYIPLTTVSLCFSFALEIPNFTHTKQQVKH